MESAKQSACVQSDTFMRQYWCVQNIFRINHDAYKVVNEYHPDLPCLMLRLRSPLRWTNITRPTHSSALVATRAHACRSTLRNARNSSL